MKLKAEGLKKVETSAARSELCGPGRGLEWGVGGDEKMGRRPKEHEHSFIIWRKKRISLKSLHPRCYRRRRILNCKDAIDSSETHHVSALGDEISLPERELGLSEDLPPMPIP